MKSEKNFRILPAIDMLQGKSVRLQKGVLDTATEVHPCALLQAKEYELQRAQWIHIVNLDGAFGAHQSGSHSMILKIINETNLRVQVGGGIRSISKIEELLKCGVEKIILGTWLWTSVFEDENLQSQLLPYSKNLVAGVDVTDNQKIALHGWKNESSIGLLKAKDFLAKMNISEALCTQISRDGMLSGIDVSFLENISQTLQIPVIASGGVRSIADVEAAKESEFLSGIILGKSLTAGTLSLKSVFLKA